MLGFFNSAEDAEAVAFTGAADRSENVYGLSTSAEVAAHYKVTAPKIILLKKVSLCLFSFFLSFSFFLYSFVFFFTLSFLPFRKVLNRRSKRR